MSLFPLRLLGTIGLRIDMPLLLCFTEALRIEAYLSPVGSGDEPGQQPEADFCIGLVVPLFGP